MTNNFDTSSSGISISTIVEWDYDISRMNFDECIKQVDGKNIYVDFGNLSDDAPEIQPLPLQKGKLIAAILKDERMNHWYDFTKKELQDDYDQEHLVNEVESEYEDEEERGEFYSEHGIKTNESDYCEISVIGYSQGDYAEVWVNIKEYEEVLGGKFDEAEMKKFIHNLFYDSPQCVRATINDEEYYSEKFDGMYGDYGSEYRYDKDSFIDDLLKATKDEGFDAELLKTELEELLPDEVQHPKGW